MNVTAYQDLDAIGLADLIKRGEASAEEAMSIAIGLAQSAHKRLNFLKFPKFEESLALARRHDAKLDRSVFSGVPFLYKDSGLASTRFESSIGSNFLGPMTYGQNSTFADRVEAAGFIPFARTAVPELCMGPTTEAVANGGNTLNPWKLELSCGGSSGGAAAAVAAGIVPVAHGSDGGGSIRIPAANCGLVGLKTSRGRFPMGPNDGDAWGDLICDGFLSRSVRDTAAALDAVGGPDAGAPFAAPTPTGSYLERLELKFDRPLKIALWTDGWDGCDPIDSHTMKALHYAAEQCRKLGHEVVEQAPADLDYAAYAAAHARVLALSIHSTVLAVTGKRGYPLKEGELEFAIEDGLKYSRTLGAHDYISALGVFRKIGRQLGQYMERYDLVLLPTVPVASARHGLLPRDAEFLEFRRRSCAYNPFVAISNASGQPAISVPIYFTEDQGLPVGVQFLGAYGDEDTLLRLAKGLEDVAPWAHRYPFERG
ncbi:amidase [Pollutimonas bauzanensis]|uniref:Amidase n=1 Tax=Pollutimonas bauzanensis TaxID=658167 RepID=A0A1M5Y8J7_9BURK|nr:amidase [Pollutimonas bauzanensis]SHI08405.1 amidase [Pollutimonas bauzanensis]